MICKFVCPVCGEYQVSRETLETFITPQLKQSLDDRLEKDDVIEVALHFNKTCPQCEPNGLYEVTLKVATTGTESES